MPAAWYGWKPDRRDDRDRVFAPVNRIPVRSRGMLAAAHLPPVWDQGPQGSCTGFMVAGAGSFLRAIKGEPAFVPSARFPYWNAREIEGTTLDDSGAQIRSAVKAVVKKGVCSDWLCRYSVDGYASRPSFLAYWGAACNLISAYERVDNSRLSHLKLCIDNQLPIAFGFAVYETFEIENEGIAKDGLMRMPSATEVLVGRHAVWAIGYDDEKDIRGQRGGFLIRNSWGLDWGEAGNFWIPYSLITDKTFAADFWVLRGIT